MDDSYNKRGFPHEHTDSQYWTAMANSSDSSSQGNSKNNWQQINYQSGNGIDWQSKQTSAVGYTPNFGNNLTGNTFDNYWQQTTGWQGETIESNQVSAAAANNASNSGDSNYLQIQSKYPDNNWQTQSNYQGDNWQVPVHTNLQGQESMVNNYLPTKGNNLRNNWQEQIENGKNNWHGQGSTTGHNWQGENSVTNWQDHSKELQEHEKTSVFKSYQTTVVDSGNTWKGEVYQTDNSFQVTDANIENPFHNNAKQTVTLSKEVLSGTINLLKENIVSLIQTQSLNIAAAANRERERQRIGLADRGSGIAAVNDSSERDGCKLRLGDKGITSLGDIDERVKLPPRETLSDRIMNDERGRLPTRDTPDRIGMGDRGRLLVRDTPDRIWTGERDRLPARDTFDSIGTGERGRLPARDTPDRNGTGERGRLIARDTHDRIGTGEKGRLPAIDTPDSIGTGKRGRLPRGASSGRIGTDERDRSPKDAYSDRLVTRERDRFRGDGSSDRVRTTKVSREGSRDRRGENSYSEKERNQRRDAVSVDVSRNYSRNNIRINRKDCYKTEDENAGYDEEKTSRGHVRNYQRGRDSDIRRQGRENSDSRIKAYDYSNGSAGNISKSMQEIDPPFKPTFVSEHMELPLQGSGSLVDIANRRPLTSQESSITKWDQSHSEFVEGVSVNSSRKNNFDTRLHTYTNTYADNQSISNPNHPSFSSGSVGDKSSYRAPIDSLPQENKHSKTKRQKKSRWEPMAQNTNHMMVPNSGANPMAELASIEQPEILLSKRMREHKSDEKEEVEPKKGKRNNPCMPLLESTFPGNDPRVGDIPNDGLFRSPVWRNDSPCPILDCSGLVFHVFEDFMKHWHTVHSNIYTWNCSFCMMIFDREEYALRHLRENAPCFHARLVQAIKPGCVFPGDIQPYTPDVSVTMTADKQTKMEAKGPQPNRMPENNGRQTNMMSNKSEGCVESLDDPVRAEPSRAEVAELMRRAINIMECLDEESVTTECDPARDKVNSRWREERQEPTRDEIDTLMRKAMLQEGCDDNM